MQRALVKLVVVFLLLGPISAAEAGEEEKAGEDGADRLELLDRIPRDPLLVWAMRVEDPRQALDGLIASVNRFADGLEPDEMTTSLAKIDETLGCSLRDDLLASLGPEVALAIDLPPIDELVGMSADPVAASQHGMSRLSLLIEVRDHEKMDGCLENMISRSGATSASADGLTRVRVPLEENTGEAPVPTFDVFYGVRDGTMAFGFNKDRVLAALEGTSEKLSSGTDFGRVFSHLDPMPFSLTYMNLPRLRRLVEASAVVKGLLQENAEARSMFAFAMSGDLLGSGFGVSSIEVDGGVRTTSFGPQALSGGTIGPGIVAAIAIPNLLNAIDRGKQKRTMADMHSIGTAFEAYAVDNERYPTTTGLVEIATIAEQVEPAYIGTLPLVDGWGGPMVIASNGQSYVIVSAGKGGELEAGWNAEAEIEVQMTQDFRSDIVFGDGQFLVWPEGVQR